MQELETPVVFVIFNRPDHTATVFEEIRKARPKKLYIIADGPRSEAERAVVERTRAATDNIDWPCDVHRIYSDTNNGCRWNPPRGITKVFEAEERAIIIEDDCVPDQSLFAYFTELLEKYKDDERVMSITGSNVQYNNPNYTCEESYWFSRMPHPWGWGSWRRAWKNYNITMDDWPEIKKRKLLKDAIPDAAAVDRLEYVFDQYYAGTISSWDGLWSLAHFVNDGLVIVPKQNMITNIGFDTNATHVKHAQNPGANLPRYPMKFPLVHPKYVLPNAINERHTFGKELGVNITALQRTLWFAKSNFPRTYRAFKRLKDRMRKR